MDKAKELETPEILQSLGSCVQQVATHIKEREFNVVVTTGQSGLVLVGGLLAGQLRNDVPIINIDYIKPHKDLGVWGIDYNHDALSNYGHGALFREHLIELGFSIPEIKLIFVDDFMSSGLKAMMLMQMLHELKSPDLIGLGLKDYGFASFIGSYGYHYSLFLFRKVMKSKYPPKFPTHEAMLRAISVYDNDASRFFVPTLMSEQVWEFMKCLENLCDYYHGYEPACAYIDNTIRRIRESVGNSSVATIAPS